MAAALWTHIDLRRFSSADRMTLTKRVTTLLCDEATLLQHQQQVTDSKLPPGWKHELHVGDEDSPGCLFTSAPADSEGGF